MFCVWLVHARQVVGGLLGEVPLRLAERVDYLSDVAKYLVAHLKEFRVGRAPLGELSMPLRLAIQAVDHNPWFNSQQLIRGGARP